MTEYLRRLFIACALSLARAFPYISGMASSADDYVIRPDPLDPRLTEHTGQQQTAEGQALFGAFSDAAPDGWGRRLIRRNEIHHAEKHGVPERYMPEIDYLLRVRDQLRQGALRFRIPAEATYLADDHRGVPHLIDLPRLLAAAEQLERDRETVAQHDRRPEQRQPQLRHQAPPTASMQMFALCKNPLWLLAAHLHRPLAQAQQACTRESVLHNAHGVTVTHLVKKLAGSLDGRNDPVSQSF